MKKYMLVLLLALFSWNIYSQMVWIKDTLNNPVMLHESGSWEAPLIFPGSVLLIDNTYHMWYFAGNFPAMGGDLRIGHASSPDGFEWTKDPDPVLELGQAGEWDDKGSGWPSVIFTDTIYHMYYSGYDSNNIFTTIGHATSKDAITWEKDPDNPVLEAEPGQWDAKKVSSPTVVFVENQFHMWYGGSANITNVNIGHATSPDGSNWTKDPGNPVLLHGKSSAWDLIQADFPDVVFSNDTFRMFYNGGKFITWEKGYATSVDGSSWEKSQYNPVLEKGGTGEWDSQYISAASVMFDTDAQVFKIWYTSSKDDVIAIGFATSPAGVTPSGIHSTAVGAAMIFPNPASGMITVSTNESGTHTLEIFSVNGKRIYTAEKSVPSYNLDLSLYEKGIYFVIIKSLNSVKAEKFIIF